MNRSFAGSATNNHHTRKQVTSTREGIDEGLLMIGVFCFLVPTMFLAAALHALRPPLSLKKWQQKKTGVKHLG